MELKGLVLHELA